MLMIRCLASRTVFIMWASALLRKRLRGISGRLQGNS